eukprot:m.75398 g.75398  ORF g.75398 m.75398 type:complete len:787 (+) comp24783_c0_seq1:192-2552(+)
MMVPGWFLTAFTLWSTLSIASCMLRSEKKAISDEVKELFHHGYNAYMNNAWPADELMPLSCKGRVRGSDKTRGDIDDALGNFSLTLVDTLDTLAVIGETSEFLRAVQLVIETVKFDANLVVSVFETNIRVLGGLLGAHAMMLELRENSNHNNHPLLTKYNDELLSMSIDLGDRLLAAFNTATGIPYSMVNLRHGMDAAARKNTATCTACAGTMLLEFAALSRFSGVPKYEQAARGAMEALWTRRAPNNLVGETINVTSGSWKRGDAGIGAGIDSYYEYLLKAYIMLGDQTYLDMFEQQYDSIMKLLRKGPFIFHANMNHPHVITRKHLDSLQMFWPGLQVLHGDIDLASAMHRMHYTLTEKYDFPPEGYTTAMNVHWGNYPLRPEFIESTYFLYQATKNPFYLEVGKKSLENLKRYTKVNCGFAAILDVRKKTHEDKMDSFMLAETFKYLYLLFTEPEDLTIDVDKFIFTTEAHMLPLSLANVSMNFRPFRPTSAPSSSRAANSEINVKTTPSVCVNNHENQELKAFLHLVGAIRKTTPRYFVEWTTPTHQQPTTTTFNMAAVKLHIDPASLNIDDPGHISYLRSLGISIEHANDGIRLVHEPNGLGVLAKREGMKFMQELMKLSRQREEEKVIGSAVVTIIDPPVLGNVNIKAGLASFGFNLEMEFRIFEGHLALPTPADGCDTITNSDDVVGRIALVRRGGCMFVTKVRQLEAAGATAVIVMDSAKSLPDPENTLFTMSGDGTDDVQIPAVFVWAHEGEKLIDYLALHSADLTIQIFGSDWSTI